MLSDKAWQRIFDDFDDDGSGEVNFDEFTDMMRKIFTI